MSQGPDDEQAQHEPGHDHRPLPGSASDEAPDSHAGAAVKEPLEASSVGMPRGVNRLWRSINPEFRSPRGLLLGLALFAVPLGLVTVLALVAAVWWIWPEGGPRVVPGTVQAIALSSDEVSKVVDTTLNAEFRTSQPAPPIGADPPGCAVAVGPATTTVYQRGWTAFLAVTHQDSEAVADHTATQVVGRYAKAEQARTAFATLVDGIQACTSAVRLDSEEAGSSWTYRVESTAAGSLAWTATQRAGDGWACYREARLIAATLLQVAVCQTGDGRQAARNLADRLAARVKG